MKRILVAMDLSEADYRLLDYVRFLGEQFPLEKVYFLHVSPELEIPVYAQSWFSDEKIIPLDERIKSEMQRAISLKIKPDLFDYELNVLEGNVTEQLLHWSKVKQTELTLVGKKEVQLGSGLAARRFLHRSSGSVWFIPDTARGKVQKIMVPTDFSDFSTLALEKAIEMSVRMQPTPTIQLVNIYDIPNGVHYQISRTREQFASMVRQNVQEYAEKYLSKIDKRGLNIELTLIENTEYNTSRHLVELAKKEKTNLIIMGAKGHNILERLLLGSVTERMLSLNCSVPMLIVRPKPKAEDDDKVILSDSRQDLMLSL
ncbi:MAG: universal stress protein [Bacteroidota bacterium]